MKILTIDFETFYGTGYTLSTMPIEEYVRDPRFWVHGAGIKLDDGPSRWVTANELPLFMAAIRARVEREPTAILCHHTQFDGFILSEKYGIRPKLWLDTMSMGRALHGVVSGVSLAKLSELYGIGSKGNELSETRNVARLNAHQEARLAAYCVNDVELTYKLFQLMRPQFPRRELRMVDMVIRMYTEPVLQLDSALLTEYLDHLRATKNFLLLRANASVEDLRSNDKFAKLLQSFGIDPPQKISKTTGKPTWAFAKTDPEMQALAEHPEIEIQALIAARTGVKSTIAESRAERFLSVASRGAAAPVYYKYSGAAQTHRLSGGDMTNYQNMTRGSQLRQAVVAPNGYVVMVIDSSNIEARLLDYLACQNDMIEAYRLYDAGLGPDIYCVTATGLYGRTIDKKKDPDERQIGKIVKLGLGYGMGPEKLFTTARQMKIPMTGDMATKAVSFYRTSVHMVPRLWKRFEDAFPFMLAGARVPIDARGILYTCKDGFVLPNGLRVMYPDLKKDVDPQTGKTRGWSYNSGRFGRVSIYGGKAVENAIQALARIVVLDQTLDLSELYKLALSSHDETGAVVLEADAPKCMADALRIFRTPPSWAPDLPLNASAGFAKRYGDAKT